MSIIPKNKLANGIAGAVKRLGPASDRLVAEGQEAKAKALKAWVEKATGWHGSLLRGTSDDKARVLGEMRDAFKASPDLRDAMRQVRSRAPRPPESLGKPFVPVPVRPAAAAALPVPAPRPARSGPGCRGETTTLHPSRGPGFSVERPSGSSPRSRTRAGEPHGSRRRP
jgi:hypothetical protein